MYTNTVILILIIVLSLFAKYGSSDKSSVWNDKALNLLHCDGRYYMQLSKRILYIIPTLLVISLYKLLYYWYRFPTLTPGTEDITGNHFMSLVAPRDNRKITSTSTFMLFMSKFIKPFPIPSMHHSIEKYFLNINSSNEKNGTGNKELIRNKARNVLIKLALEAQLKHYDTSTGIKLKEKLQKLSVPGVYSRK